MLELDRDRLQRHVEQIPELRSLPKAATAVTTRVADWLTTADSATCPIHISELLIVASRSDSALEISVTPTERQLPDPEPPILQPVLSFLPPEPTFTLVKIPFSEISKSESTP